MTDDEKLIAFLILVGVGFAAYKMANSRNPEERKEGEHLESELFDDAAEWAVEEI